MGTTEQDLTSVGTGAVTGAAAGSAFGPIGTAVGAVGGGLLGWLSRPDDAKPGIPTSVGQPRELGPLAPWGGYDWAAPDYVGYGMGNSKDAFDASGALFGEAQLPRMPQIVENQELSDRESMTRGWDQAGSMELAREAAMGQAPSAAAYQMQTGLDQALANQQALAGGARGAGAIAQAQSQAAGNAAAMQTGAVNQAAAMRAQEMATARGLYGGLSGQMREQDLQRLGLGNAVSGQNASLNDSNRLGLINSAVQYGQLGNNIYNTAMTPYNTEFTGNVSARGQDTSAAIAGANNATSISATNVTSGDRAQDRADARLGTQMYTAGQAVPQIQKNLTRAPTGTGMQGTLPAPQPQPQTGTPTKVYSDPNHPY